MELESIVYLPFSQSPSADALKTDFDNPWALKEGTVKETREDGRLIIELNQPLKVTSVKNHDEVFTSDEAGEVLKRVKPPIKLANLDLSKPNTDAAQALKKAVEARRAKI